jgi:hypothetical protein
MNGSWPDARHAKNRLHRQTPLKKGYSTKDDHQLALRHCPARNFPDEWVAAPQQAKAIIDRIVPSHPLARAAGLISGRKPRCLSPRMTASIPSLPVVT